MNTFAYNREIIEINKDIARLVKSLDPSARQYCKEYLEKNLQHLLENKLEMSLIVDANAVISDALAYVEKGKSFLMEISKSPFLKMRAPDWLKQELDKKIPEIAGKRKISEEEFRKAVFDILEKVELEYLTDSSAYFAACLKVGYKDPKDVPYVALYFSVKSHGILTKDRDITNLSGIKTWEKPGQVGKIIGIFEEGAFSFLVIGEGLAPVLRFLFETFITVLSSIWEIIKSLGNAIYSLVNGVVKTISNFPEWVKTLLLAAGVIVIHNDRVRTVIVDALNTLAQEIASVLTWFCNAIKSLLTIIAPFVEIAVAILMPFFSKIGRTIEIYNQINVQPLE